MWRGEKWKGEENMMKREIKIVNVRGKQEKRKTEEMSSDGLCFSTPHMHFEEAQSCF